MIVTRSPEYPNLLSPFTIGSTHLQNRFVFQPHYTALLDNDGMPNDALRAYYVERAMGSVGLIVDGHMTVMVEGMMSPHYIRAWEEDFIPGYARMVEEIHAAGTKIFGQVTHAGHTTLTEPPPVLWAPTQMPEPSSRHTTHAMDMEDIRRTVKGFGDASRNIVATGADGIEVKIAHDGLLRSFASPFFNQRSDAYGGSFEKRMRLSLEVLEAIRSSIGPNAPIGVRLCLHEFTPFGYELDYGLRMAEAFESSGLVDYFNCDAGTFSSFWMEIPPAAVAQGFFRPLNQALKQQSDLPIVAFGRINDPAMGEQMLELGEADLIGMARPLIADPEIPRKLAESRGQEIRACISCNDACIFQVVQSKPIRCTQNPAAGQEERYSERLLLAARTPRRIVVVGAGPAGLKVAEIAARRGHRVSLLERGPRVGGQIRLAAQQPLHDEIAEVVSYLEGTIQRVGVDLELDTEADATRILDLDPDVVIIATGSQPDLPPARLPEWDRDAASIARSRGFQVPNRLPGLDEPIVRSVDEVLAHPPRTRSSVLLIDAHGHWEAAGTAEFLHDHGCRVEIVTDRAEVGFGLEATNRVMFHQRALEKGIRMSPLTKVEGIGRDEVTCRSALDGSERRIGDVDVVVPVYPRSSRDDLFYEVGDRLGERTDVELIRIGDASAPRLVVSILLESQQIGMSL